MLEDARKLLLKYRQGKATAKEKALLENWMHDFNAAIEHGLSDTQLAKAHQENWKAVQQQIKTKQPRPLWQSIAAAASVLLCLSLAFYFYSPKTRISDSQTTISPIAPGGNKAFLTLANGKKISLTDADKGNLAEEPGIKITKTAEGILVYHITDKHGQGNNTSNNTIETPIGGEYQLILPDGSKVWLNAASKLTFPSSFIGHKERKVELSGEAYFEITTNKASPFLVRSAGQEVKVLGTHFNINAYNNERQTTTTLLEGAVKILNLKQGDYTLLKPGQQAALNAGSISVYQTDTEEAVAWKNGLFVFDDEHITEIMKKISRWYNVEVTFRGNMDKVYFVGNYSRHKNLENLLKNIEMTGKVYFKVEGRRIEVIAR